MFFESFSHDPLINLHINACKVNWKYQLIYCQCNNFPISTTPDFHVLAGQSPRLSWVH